MCEILLGFLERDSWTGQGGAGQDQEPCKDSHHKV